MATTIEKPKSPTKTPNEHDANKIRVRADYMMHSCENALKAMINSETVELHGLGNAIPTTIEVTEYLTSKKYATLKSK